MWLVYASQGGYTNWSSLGSRQLPVNSRRNQCIGWDGYGELRRELVPLAQKDALTNRWLQRLRHSRLFPRRLPPVGAGRVEWTAG
jgi:hypothetical protein